MWLYFMDDNDLKAQVKKKEVKQVSSEKLAFHAPFIELLTIFRIIQESDCLTQKQQAKFDMAVPMAQDLGSMDLQNKQLTVTKKKK